MLQSAFIRQANTYGTRYGSQKGVPGSAGAGSSSGAAGSSCQQQLRESLSSALLALSRTVCSHLATDQDTTARKVSAGWNTCHPMLGKQLSACMTVLGMLISCWHTG